jgi:ArsR family transcriptional regulator, arsenate/arsenite/antimonite-responsive transcriptional repressor
LTAADSFKALGDPIRLRLFYLLSLRDEVCVCHLTDALELPQSTVSRHLAVLRHAGLVDTRRDGKWIHYRLDGELTKTLIAMIRELADDTQRADARRLASMMKNCD